MSRERTRERREREKGREKVTRSLLSAHCRFVYDVRFPVLRIHTIITKCQACTCDLLSALPYDTLNNDLCKAALRSPIRVRKRKKKEKVSLAYAHDELHLFLRKKFPRMPDKIGRDPFVYGELSLIF